MFLEDRLLKIAREAEVETQEDVIHAVSKMVQECFKFIGSKKYDNVPSIRASVLRVNKIWMKVANTLSEEGKGIIQREGFENFIRNDPDLAPILNDKLKN